MYQITHFARQSSVKDGSWLMIGFITADQDGVFRFGIDNSQHFNKQEICSRVSGGLLIELNEPINILPEKNKHVWLQGPDEDAKVWLANYEAPMTDPNKILLWQGALFKSITS